MLNKKVLVKGITSLSEARYCAGMFVDYISFDFEPNSDFFTDDKQFEEIRGWLSGVKILGSKETANEAEISEIINEKNLDGFIFSQSQYLILGLVHANTKVLEWSFADLGILPSDLDSEVILILTAGSEIAESQIEDIPNLVLQGYDFENVKYLNEEIEGYAFNGSIETQIGNNAYHELIEALEFIDENY